MAHKYHGQVSTQVDWYDEMSTKLLLKDVIGSDDDSGDDEGVWARRRTVRQVRADEGTTVVCTLPERLASGFVVVLCEQSWSAPWPRSRCLCSLPSCCNSTRHSFTPSLSSFSISLLPRPSHTLALFIHIFTSNLLP
jgi:hypothetical protein